MENPEINNYIGKRIDLVLNNKVSATLNYTNGILLHGVPDNLFNKAPIDWKNMEQVNVVKKAFNKFSDTSFSEIADGQIGLNDNDFTIFFNNGIIESFFSRIVKQTPINFPPKIRYVQVETIVSQIMNFINALNAVVEKCYASKSSFTVFISLVGLKGVVFNATEKDYTTTVAFPKNTLTFQINKLNEKGTELIKKSIEKAIHTKLSQFEPVA